MVGTKAWQRCILLLPFFLAAIRAAPHFVGEAEGIAKAPTELQGGKAAAEGLRPSMEAASESRGASEGTAARVLPAREEGKPIENAHVRNSEAPHHIHQLTPEEILLGRQMHFILRHKPYYTDAERGLLEMQRRQLISSQLLKAAAAKDPQFVRSHYEKLLTPRQSAWLKQSWENHSPQEARNLHVELALKEDLIRAELEVKALGAIARGNQPLAKELLSRADDFQRWTNVLWLDLVARGHLRDVVARRGLPKNILESALDDLSPFINNNLFKNLPERDFVRSRQVGQKPAFPGYAPAYNDLHHSGVPASVSHDVNPPRSAEFRGNLPTEKYDANAAPAQAPGQTRSQAEGPVRQQVPAARHAFTPTAGQEVAAAA